MASLAASTALAKAPKDFFGVDPQAPLVKADLDRMGQGKVGTLRFEIFWAGQNPAPGVYEWGAVDQIVRDAARNDIRLVPFIFSTPPWVAKLDGRNCDGGECLAFAPQGQKALEAWKSFLREAVDRYGPNGGFWGLNPTVPKKPIRAWQIWNEQNSPSFYKPKPNVKAYERLLDAADKAIGSVDPRADVILGGMFGTPLGGRRPGISAWDYLGKLYDIRGAKRHFDGVAPHPYASQLSKVKAQVELLRAEMKKAGDSKTKLWVTEVGWASGGPPNPLNKGKRGQARRLTELYRFFLKKRRAWHVETVDWYSWRDNPNPNVGLCEWCPFSGLMTKDLNPKPSWKAFIKFTGGS
jgi:hypothetical protein